jgi:hypothetical protein
MGAVGEPNEAVLVMCVKEEMSRLYSFSYEGVGEGIETAPVTSSLL